jgi:acyl-CoA reductase-like NAD-dependent aldehyde dehydrogenase
VNLLTLLTVTAPLGGAKGSGWGRCNGSYGIEEFLIEKLLYVSSPDAVLGFHSL